MSTLLTCPNCLYVYGSIQDRCPVCEANQDGENGMVEIDDRSRSQVQRCGGVSGGVLELGRGAALLWCERGLVLVDEECGLRWGLPMGVRVDEVRVEGEFVRVRCGREESVLTLDDGQPL